MNKVSLSEKLSLFSELWSPKIVRIVPKGVEHKPVAEDETHIPLLEPSSTLNTGNVRNERSVDSPGRL